MSRSVVVFKVGGSLRGAHLSALVEACELALSHDQHIVLVHGGGPRITAALESAGIAATFVKGQRVTSPEAMVVVERVLAEEVNGEMVAALRQEGLPVTGLRGSDGMLFVDPIPGLMRVGQPDHVDPVVIQAVWDDHQIPLIAPIGTDTEGNHYNVNADLAAAAIAGAVEADRIVFLTDVPGIYADFDTKDLLGYTDAQTLIELEQRGKFSTGMIPKVTSVLTSVDHGVTAAFVVHGSNAEALRWAVETPVNGRGGNTEEAGTPFGTCVTRRR